AFFERTYGWTPQQAGLILGIVQLCAAPIGLFVGFRLSEHFARRNDDANLRVVTIAWALAIPTAVAAPLMPSGELSAACGFLATLFAMMGTPTQNAALQSVTPGHLRGKITA